MEPAASDLTGELGRGVEAEPVVEQPETDDQGRLRTTSAKRLPVAVEHRTITGSLLARRNPASSPPYIAKPAPSRRGVAWMSRSRTSAIALA
jgi:hypothetical protein